MVLGTVLVFTLGYLGIRASTRVGILLGAFEILVILALAITLKAGSHNTLSVFSTQFANNPKYPGVLWDYRGLGFQHSGVHRF